MAISVAEGVDTSADVVVAVTMVTESTVDEAMLLTGVDVTVSSTDEVSIMDVVINGVSDGDDMEISVPVTVSEVIEGSGVLVLVVAIGTTVEEVISLAGVDVKGSAEDDMSVDKTDVESVAEMNKELEEVKATEGVTIVLSVVVVIATAEDSNALEIVSTVTDGVTEVVVMTSEDNDVKMDALVVVAKVSTGVEITDGIVVEVTITEVCDVNAVVSGIETMLVEVGIKVSAEVKVTVVVTGVSETTGIGVSETTSVGVSEITGVEVSETTGVGVSEIIGVEVSETTGVEVSETTGVEVSETTGVGVSETIGVEVSETTGVGVSEITGVEVSETTGVGVSEITGVGVSETTGVGISEATEVKVSGVGVAEVGVGETKEVNEVEDGVESVSDEKVAVRETGCSVETTSAVVDSAMDTF